ncbi:MAG: hypothetical protein ACFFCS_09000 [Candidatus Hodarchaeota archaeon]
MSENIFVPIDYSDAVNHVPAGEQIIYSTMVEYVQQRVNDIATAASRYVTHMLITENGMVYNKIKSKKKPPEYRYIPWTDIYSTGQRMGWGYISTGMSIQPGAEIFYLRQDKNFEDKKTFKERSKKFPLVSLPLIIQSKKDLLQSPAAAGLKPSKINKIEKQILKLEKQYDKAAKKLG